MQPMPHQEPLGERNRRLTAHAAAARQAEGLVVARRKSIRRALGSALIAAGRKLAPGSPAPRPH